MEDQRGIGPDCSHLISGGGLEYEVQYDISGAHQAVHTMLMRVTRRQGYSAKPRTPEEGTKTVILASVDDPKKYNWTPEKGDAIRLSNCKEQPAPESTADRQERREIYQEIQQILANHLSGIPTELKA